MPRKLTDMIYVLVHDKGTKDEAYGRYYNAEWDANRFATGGEFCRVDKKNVTVKKMSWRVFLKRNIKRSLDAIIARQDVMSIDEVIAYLQKANGES